MAPALLPPATPELARDDVRPYFVWWADVTTGDVRRFLRSNDPAERGYWLGALLREANSRDVWLFTTVEQIRRDWPHVYRHLGRARDRWADLMELPRTPPAEMAP
jgi:hypothetical protein